MLDATEAGVHECAGSGGLSIADEQAAGVTGTWAIVVLRFPLAHGLSCSSAVGDSSQRAEVGTLVVYHIEHQFCHTPQGGERSVPIPQLPCQHNVCLKNNKKLSHVATYLHLSSPSHLALHTHRPLAALPSIPLGLVCLLKHLTDPPFAGRPRKGNKFKSTFQISPRRSY